MLGKHFNLKYNVDYHYICKIIPNTVYVIICYTIIYTIFKNAFLWKIEKLF